MTKLKCGLIQMALKGDTEMAPEAIRAPCSRRIFR